MKKLAILAAVLVCLPFMWSAAAQANLLTNGSFEDTTKFVANADDTMVLSPPSTAMPGWTVVNEELAWIGPKNPFGLTASNGSYFLDLTSYRDESPFGGVQQGITLSPGKYRLTFDLGSSTTYGLPSAIAVLAGSTSQTFTSTNIHFSNAWETYTMPFTVSGPGLTLISFSLTGSTGNKYIGLDNVDVEAVPVPPSALLLGSGLLGLVGLGWKRGRAG